MNVTFHTLTSCAAAAMISSRQKGKSSHQLFTLSDLPVLIGSFVLGVLLHGLLDYAPHDYPIKSSVDVVLSLILFFTVLYFTRRAHWPLLGACFIGSIFPDLVDLGTSIINKRLEWSLPVVKIFPWHWREYSGSIYDGSRRIESLLYHLIVVGSSLGLLYAYRRQLLHSKGKR